VLHSLPVASPRLDRGVFIVSLVVACAVVLLVGPVSGQPPERRAGAYREHEARALTDLARSAVGEGKVGEALEFHLAALAIYRETGGKVGVAATLFEMGQINNGMFNYEGAVGRLAEAAAIYRELGARAELARVNLVLGRSQMMLGRRMDAIALLEDALAEFTRTGDADRASEARALLQRLQ